MDDKREASRRECRSRWRGRMVRASSRIWLDLVGDGDGRDPGAVTART